MNKKSKKGEWVVILRGTGDKILFCSNCSARQAKNDPFKHAFSESEWRMNTTWKVHKVEPYS